MPRRPDLPCADCGEMMWRGASSLPAGLARCIPCRKRNPQTQKAIRSRRTVTKYVCGGCSALVSRPPRKGQRPKWCEECRKVGKSWISAGVRRAIYERDEWTCGICSDPVDSALIGTRDIWRPSLDHIVPRSKGGSDEPANLRLAHLWCNSVRCDERTYTDADLRAA